MLADDKTYQPVEKDPTLPLERKMNALLLQLKKKGSIDQNLYNRLHSSGGSTPLLYGLPKIHKPDVPLRPIVQSPMYQLSKHLTHILSPLIGNTESNVLNSVEFATFMHTRTVHDDEVLVSFDVVSLFTNVPVKLATEVARHRLQSDDSLSSRMSLSPDELSQLLEFCLTATYLSFQGQPYKQVFGTAVGSPVSVAVANLVKEDVENRALETFDIQLPFWKRFVDDTCTVVPRDRVYDLLNHLNNTEESIQFTCETESNGCLPFLDVLISHQSDGSIQTSVYRKGTHTDRYLDYDSHHPLSHKKSVASTLMNRAHTHSSRTSSRNKEVRHVGNALRMNGYPSRLTVDPRRASGNSQILPISDQTTQWRASTTIPYIRGVAESIRRIYPPWASEYATNHSRPLDKCCLTQKTQCLTCRDEVWFTGFPVLPVTALTLVRLEGNYSRN